MMAVLFPGKFVYISTPHTATISTTAALAGIKGAWSTSINQTAKLHLEHYFDRDTHHSTRAALLHRYPEAFEGGELAVTTIRNPYDMSVTWWLRQKTALAERLKIIEPTFEEYITNYCGEGGPYIREGKIYWLDADEHLCYENLQENLDSLLERFDLPKVTLPKYNVSGKIKPASEYHTTETLRYMRETFGKEISDHGYDVL